MWIESEMTVNHDITKRNYLYRVMENQTYNGKTGTFSATPGPMAKAILQEVPGIANAARTTMGDRELFSLQDKNMNESGFYADANLFSMLGLQFISGNPANAFKQLHSVVISEKMAGNFFGKTDPVGRMLKVNNKEDYMVSGVFKNLPENSTIKFQWLAPFEIAEAESSWMKGWGENGLRTFVELAPTANVAAVNKQLFAYLRTKGNIDTKCFLFSMNDWNLRDRFVDGKMAGGRIQYVQLFSAIALIILLIACINFMNLVTAHSEKRAKEVGVRKVMGAGRGRLISQFMLESLVIAFMAITLAVLMLYLVLPFFNAIVEKQLSVNILRPLHLCSLLAIGLMTGLIAGSYPALYLSSFNPLGALKQMRMKTALAAGFIRRGLVVTQFSVSIILIIATVIVYQQIEHVKARNLGFNMNNLISMQAQGNISKHFDVIHHDLIATGVVANATLSGSAMLSIWNNTDNYTWKGKDPRKNVLITNEFATPQYLSTMDIRLIEGRDFYANIAADSNNVIINQTFAKQMGAEGRIGGIIRNNNRQLQIVGIMGNFSYNNMYASGASFMLYSSVGENANYMSIRLKPGTDLTAALDKVEKVMRLQNPSYPFEYKFTDVEFNNLFKVEALIGKLAGIFAGLAIFISCLGLFGLAAYTAERRTKEIGIRKVMGASITGLVGLLSKEFVKLVATSCLIAFPLAWWLMYRWLNNYEYRVAINWWIFLIAGTAAMAIALITVSYQAVRVALLNPVKSLKAE
ncbi:ABC transporter permease [Chitinophaga niastensis]|uniref:ABC transporter permease n=1 Tax=Chitinophaga niastensis TaxID=536980 RepID=UPI003CCB8167